MVSFFLHNTKRRILFVCVCFLWSVIIPHSPNCFCLLDFLNDTCLIVNTETRMPFFIKKISLYSFNWYPFSVNDDIKEINKLQPLFLTLQVAISRWNHEFDHLHCYRYCNQHVKIQLFPHQNKKKMWGEFRTQYPFEAVSLCNRLWFSTRVRPIKSGLLTDQSQNTQRI